MGNFFIENPELIIFTVVFVGMFIYGMSKNLVYTTRVSDLAKKLALLAPEYLDEFADVHVSTTYSKKDPDYGYLSLIADGFTKGYDFILIEQPKAGSQIPLHKHKRSNELFYVIDGKIKVFVCDKNTATAACMEGCNNATELTAGDWLFVKAKKEHCIEVVEPAKYIIIAKPQLFSRIGKLYEVLFKKKTKE